MTACVASTKGTASLNSRKSAVAANWEMLGAEEEEEEIKKVRSRWLRVRHALALLCNGVRCPARDDAKDFPGSITHESDSGHCLYAEPGFRF